MPPRVVLFAAMNAPSPTADATLADLASLGMRAARVVTRMMEIEGQAADIVASWLPEPGCAPASATYATTSGLAIDMMTSLMAEAVPRTEKLARAMDKLGRLVRFTIALQRRIEAGWTGTRADTKAAMTKRQVARKVGETIRRETEGEAAERLFDDLYERLEDPAIEAELAAMPVDEVVRKICRDLGLAAQALEAALPPASGPSQPAIDTG